MFSKTDLEQKTNRELMQMCQDRGITFYTGKTKSNKAVLVGRLMDYYGVSEARKEEPEKKPRKRAFNTAISYMEKAALKKAIRDCSEAESSVCGMPSALTRSSTSTTPVRRGQTRYPAAYRSWNSAASTS